MSNPIVFMYSGQGAQYFQMGKQLFETDQTFQNWFRRCDAIVSPLIGVSLVDLIYSEPTDKYAIFQRTLHTHPAIVSFSYSMTKCVIERGVLPDMLLGYSLGEYISSIIAGAMSLEDGLTMIVNQAKALEAKTEGAGMIAILENPRIMKQRPELFSGTWLAGHNFANHFVVTGRRPALEKIDETLRNERITTQILPISHGFHSPMVEPIEEDCRAIGNLNPLQTPVISALNTGPLQAINGDHIYNVIRNPVRFYETVQIMESKGSYNYIDLGPAGTLSTFVKYALDKNSKSQALPCVNQFGRDQVSMNNMLKAIDHA